MLVVLNQASTERTEAPSGSPMVLVIWTYSLVPSKAVAVSGSPLIAPATPNVGAFRYMPGLEPLPSTARGMMRKLSVCIPVVLDAETARSAAQQDTGATYRGDGGVSGRHPLHAVDEESDRAPPHVQRHGVRLVGGEDRACCAEGGDGAGDALAQQPDPGVGAVDR